MPRRALAPRQVPGERAARAEQQRKGSIGRPGTIASTASRPLVVAERPRVGAELAEQGAVGRVATPALATRRPAAVDTTRAGICETRPSPTVSSV